MHDIIIATAAGKEVRSMLYSEYDFEVGLEENSFEVKILRPEWQPFDVGSRVYIPGTEYGGLYRRMSTNTEEGTISVGGMTWRGMMQKKIISPPSGQDYATDSGELNEIIKARVEAALPGLFIGSSESTGVTVSWQYARYCTLEEGLRDMLESVDYRLNIEYSQTDKAVVVSAVPIENYSDDVQFSADWQLNYYMRMQSDGVNHLILLGQGELKDRVVRHLYLNKNGKIVTTQYYTGVNEVAEVYDYPGAEEDDLIQNGKEHFKEMVNNNLFEIKVDQAEGIAIGDIVGGHDYLSGLTMSSPVTGKVVSWRDGFQNIEYQLSDAIELE